MSGILKRKNELKCAIIVPRARHKLLGQLIGSEKPQGLVRQTDAQDRRPEALFELKFFNTTL